MVHITSRKAMPPMPGPAPHERSPVRRPILTAQARGGSLACCSR
jgi:hypothetical protein